jgi:hypothetical protein
MRTFPGTEFDQPVEQTGKSEEPTVSASSGGNHNVCHHLGGVENDIGSGHDSASRFKRSRVTVETSLNVGSI